jgi:hypothetical protein
MGSALNSYRFRNVDSSTKMLNPSGKPTHTEAWWHQVDPRPRILWGFVRVSPHFQREGNEAIYRRKQFIQSKLSYVKH